MRSKMYFFFFLNSCGKQDADHSTIIASLSWTACWRNGLHMLRGLLWNRYCLCCPYHVETHYRAAKDEGRAGQQQLSLFHDKCDLAQRSNFEMLTTPSWQAISALQTRRKRQNMSVYLSYSSMKQHIFQTMWSFCYFEALDEIPGPALRQRAL